MWVWVLVMVVAAGMSLLIAAAVGALGLAMVRGKLWLLLLLLMVVMVVLQCCPAASLAFLLALLLELLLWDDPFLRRLRPHMYWSQQPSCCSRKPNDMPKGGCLTGLHLHPH